MQKRKKKRLWGALGSLLMPVLAVLVLVIFFTGISNLRNGSGEEGMKQLDASLRRAIAACYATEGIYPPSIEYLEENYGLQVDESRYYIDYSIFASNLMPSFTILDVSESGDT